MRPTVPLSGFVLGLGLVLTACSSHRRPAPAATASDDPKISNVRKALLRQAGEIGVEGNVCAGRDDGECAPNAFRGSVRIGAFRAVGRLNHHDIQDVITKHLDEFRQCYDARLKVDPTTRGTVIIAFKIGPMGTPKEIHDDGSALDDQELLHCVQKTVIRFEFPAPEAGVVDMTLPLLFDGVER